MSISLTDGSESGSISKTLVISSKLGLSPHVFFQATRKPHENRSWPVARATQNYHDSTSAQLRVDPISSKSLWDGIYDGRYPLLE